MKHSHMVILWENEDGSVTLSQRYAAGHRLPEVVDSPPRIATAAEPILPSVCLLFPFFRYLKLMSR
jgi:hypothetical protein